MPATATRGGRGERVPLATAKQVAAYLGVPVGTLHNWRLKGYGPRAARVGRDLRYAWADVDAWVEAQSSTASH